MLVLCERNVIRRTLLFVTAMALASRCAWGQVPAPQWEYPAQAWLPTEAWHQGLAADPGDASLVARGPRPLNRSPGEATYLSELSDEELVDLYINAYQQSLRSVVADQASLVEPGRVLLQAGYTFSYNRHADLSNTTHTLPEVMFRYRLMKRLELRVAWAGVVLDALHDSQTGVRDWDTSLSDPSVGARVLLCTQRGALPAMSATIASPLNVTANLSVAERLDPFVGIGYSWMLSDAWLLSGNSAAVWTREGDSRFLDFQQTVSLDWVANDRWGAYLEWSSLFPEGARVTGMSHAIGPGVSYNFSRNCQLDVVALCGLDEPSPDILTQVLLSWRL